MAQSRRPPVSDPATPDEMVDRVEVQDTKTVDFGISVPDGHTLEVVRWGCWRDGGTTPAGLDVVIMDGSRTVQDRANTPDSGIGPSVVASLENTSGGEKKYYLGVENGTGSDILAENDEWVTGHFTFGVTG